MESVAPLLLIWIVDVVTIVPVGDAGGGVHEPSNKSVAVISAVRLVRSIMLSPFLPLLSVYRVGEQHAAGASRAPLIAGRNINHAAGDCRAGAIEPAAGRFATTERAVGYGGVYVPHRLAARRV